MDPLIWSRAQFGITIGFHFLYVPISIGLAWFLVLIEGLGFFKNDPHYEKMGKFFAKLLGINFAIGVGTGLVMVLQFGTNWSRYSSFVGEVFGAPLAAEAGMAFFMEASFIAIYLWGRDRIRKAYHWGSICMVALGTTLSAFCILVANSWQQTPAGFKIVGDKAELVSLYDTVFNPSMWPRFFHTMDAALISGAFFMAGICALLLLRDRTHVGAQKVLELALCLGFIFSAAEIFPFGHISARTVAVYQPSKLAAFEGLYKTETDAPLVIFAIPGEGPDPKLKDVIQIPGLLSWIAFGNTRDKVLGIEHFPKEKRPPLIPSFVSFHLMVALGTLFLGITALGVFLFWRRKLIQSRWFLYGLALSIPLPVFACELGWIAAEMGRQPWAVYGLLRTQHAVSPMLDPWQVCFSTLLFSAIYSGLLVAYLILVRREVRNGA